MERGDKEEGGDKGGGPSTSGRKVHPLPARMPWRTKTEQEMRREGVRECSSGGKAHPLTACRVGVGETGRVGEWENGILE